MPSPADALMRLGLFKGGMDPGAVLNSLLSFLVMQGFAPKMEGLKSDGKPLDDAAKLADALKQMQGKEGLAQTGRLDEKTMKALEKYKPAQPQGERATERQAATMERQTTARAANSFREQNLASWIKNKTGDTPPQVKPPSIQTQTQNPATPAQQSAQMRPETTAQQQQTQLTQQQPDNQVQKQTREAVMDQKSAQADGRATRESGDGKPPPTAAKESHGAKGQEGGAGKPSQDKQGVGSGQQDAQIGGRSNEEEGLARGEAEDQLSYEDGRGNQATGDEDEEDERRGAALVDDGSGADEGAYQIPSLREQIDEALQKLAVEENTDPNRPTTYKCEFLLYKPGVYQSRTQASQVLNMKVVKATAYDPVWEKVVEQVNARLRAFEPEAPQLEASEVQTALSIARVRAW